MTVHSVPSLVSAEVEHITLDRPERRNALDHDTLTALLEALEMATAARRRAVVLSGVGGHFCAGADLSTVEDDAFVALLRGVLEALRRAPMPVIAALEGAALGAGTQLALACDLRIATPTAMFGIPAAKLGLTVDQWTVQQLGRQVGHSVARAMLVGAEVFRAERLYANGFIHRIVDPGMSPFEAADTWAVELAAYAPLTIAAHKKMLRASEPAIEAPDDVAAARLAAWRSDDLAEGLDAFSQHRSPVFRGR